MEYTQHLIKSIPEILLNRVKCNQSKLITINKTLKNLVIINYGSSKAQFCPASGSGKTRK